MEVSGQKNTSKKYFLAVVLPAPLLEKVEKIKEELCHEYGLKGALRSPSHITLHRPFEWREQKEHLLVEKLNGFSRHHPFQIELNNYNFFEPRVVFIDVKASGELNLLHGELSRYAQKELRLFNEVDDLRGFHPHVTIAFRDLKKPVYYKLKERFASETFNGNFEYQGFSLLKLEKRWEVIKNFTASP